MKIYDISASICENLPSYDNKKPTIDNLLQIKNGDTCNFSEPVFMGMRVCELVYADGKL